MRKALPCVGVFFALAVGLTFLASQLPELAFEHFDARLVLCGCGPLLSGLFCYRFFKTDNAIKVSVLGTKPVWSVVVCIVALVTFRCTQGHRELQLVLTWFAVQFAYCFGEEFGWRHYLQNATNFLNDWTQSLLIGSLWFAWHYAFLEDVSASMFGGGIPGWAFVPVMIVLLSLQSYVFGLMVKRSRSLLFPVVGHMLFKTGLVTMLVTGSVACLLLIFWRKLPAGRGRVDGS